MSWLHERARIGRTVAAVIMVALASFLAVTPADPARAATGWSQDQVSAAYGTSWSALYYGESIGFGGEVEVRYAGPLSGSYWIEANEGPVYIESSLGGTATLPLPVGNYEFIVHVHFGHERTSPAYSSPPLPVVVSKSALATSVSVVADPANPSGAVISLATSGAFVDEVIGYGEGDFPGGTWSVTAVTRDGETVLESEFPQRAGGPAVFNTYWSGIPEDTVFDVSATYSVGSAESGGFTVTSGSTSFTSPRAQSPTASPAPLPTAAPEAEGGDSGAIIPVWTLLLLAAAALAMVAAIAVLAIRARVRRTPAGSADAKEDDVVAS